MAFRKGESGNPGGRPKALKEIEELCRAETPEAIKTLASIHRDTEAPHSARVAAANSLMDRGWGKPRQSVEMTGKDGGPLNMTVRFVHPGQV